MKEDLESGIDWKIATIDIANIKCSNNHYNFPILGTEHDLNPHFMPRY